jgi:UDP-4-amino-4,6-dideoxy-N-acetyl-beta-L-altrosamine transaminase
LKYIPYGKQDINQQDIDAVLEVLTSDSLTQGQKVPEFESSVSAYTDSNYSIAVNSATSALHIACLALDLKSGDYLWTSPISFVASANCGLYCGASVDFVDIDPDTFNLCPNALEAKLKQAKKENKLPKIIIPVHLAGQSCTMRAIYKLAKQYGVFIIEDASHAIGGRYLDSPIGGCQYSDITVFSFHPVKIITTAEGGVATTNCPVLAQSMIMFRSHGITRDPSLVEGIGNEAWAYEQQTLGFNYRMTELQAALGCSQLTRLDQFVNKRHSLAEQYAIKLKHLPILLPQQDKESYSAYHLYIIRLESEGVRLKVFNYLREQGIGVNVHYIPIHTQPYYKAMGFKSGDFPVAEAYYSCALSVPLFPKMTDDDQNKVVSALATVLLK